MFTHTRLADALTLGTSTLTNPNRYVGQSLCLESKVRFINKNQLFHQKSLFIPTAVAIPRMRVHHLSFICKASFQSLMPLMDVAAIVEAGFHPKMHCNHLPLTHADVVYSNTFRRREFEQRGPKITISGISDGTSVSTKDMELPVSPECPINSQHCHCQKLCTPCPSILQLVRSEKTRFFHCVFAFYPFIVKGFPPL